MHQALCMANPAPQYRFTKRKIKQYNLLKLLWRAPIGSGYFGVPCFAPARCAALHILHAEFCYTKVKYTLVLYLSLFHTNAESIDQIEKNNVKDFIRYYSLAY